MSIKVAIFDDNKQLLDSLFQLINGTPGFACVGALINCKELATDIYEKLQVHSKGEAVPVNAKKPVRAVGVEAGVEYKFWKNYIIAGNFIYQETSERDPHVDSWLFQIAPVKTNLSLSNPKCYRNFGFSVNWHWTDAMAGYWSLNPEAEIDNNNIHANSIIDAQVTLSLPKINSSIKAGASNLLNHYYQNIAYGSSIGGVYYISVLFEGK